MLPGPLLALFVLVLSPVEAHPLAAEAADARASRSSGSPTANANEAAPSTTLSIPILRRNRLERRVSRDALRDWALREKERITTKYGPPVDAKAVRARQVRRDDSLDKRQTRFSTAGYGPTSNPAAGTRTFASPSTSLPTGTAAPSNVTIGRVDIMNYEADLEYFASIGVGAPPQYMDTILDTGSADMWIAAGGCNAFSGCVNTPLFNMSTSTSLRPANTSFLVNYGSGSAGGELYNDYIAFGGYNVSQQGFALVDEVSSGLLTGNISGMTGLGWKPLAASGFTPFWQNLFQANVLPFPGFAFQLSRFVNISSAASVEPGGSLTIGYLNESLYEPPINYISIPNNLQSYWVIPMDNVNVNGTNVTNVGTPLVAIDTGTTLIGGPSNAVSGLYSLIPGAQAASGDYAGYYHYPCNQSVNVSLIFGDQMYNISAADFNLGPFSSVNNVSTCLGSFFDLSLSSSSRISWVIGASFLKNVYSVYRASPPSVGFALLSNGTRRYNGTSTNGTNTTIVQVPTGVIGPTSGPNASATSTAPPAPPTTAIEAGQTATKTTVPNSASLRLAQDTHSLHVLIMVALLVGSAIIIL